MQTKYTTQQLRSFFPPKNKRGRGFALIASLTLMMLLGLIAVGILAVASTQNRIASVAGLQTEARQQALMGLDAALAEMQVALGPDQRVTASSGIISENKEVPQHILGVWDSWQRALYDKEDEGIKSTYQDGRQSRFRRWLISSRTPKELSNFEAVRNMGSRDPGIRICLLGEGTLGRNSDIGDHVYADMIEMPAANEKINNAYFAWWVSGENQKANAGIAPAEEPQDDEERLHRTWDTPVPSFFSSPTLSMLDTLTAEDRAKLITRKSLSIIGGSANAVNEHFHDVTLYSYSLPINVRDAGFKQDINLLLNKKSLNGTPYTRRSGQDCPIADDDAMPSGTEQNMPIGSWQVMHAYYNTWPNGSSKTNDNFSARLIGNITTASTRISGGLEEETTPKGERVTYYTTRTEESDDKAGYARSPIMMTFLGCWGLTARVSTYNKGHTINYLYSPMIMWWNPYNVQMKVGPKKLWCYSLPYRTASIQAWSDRAQLYDPERPWSPKVMLHPCSGDGVTIPWQCCFRLDWGNYFINSESDDASDIVFEPGEIIAFTMAGDVWSMNDVNDVGLPQDQPFISGDHPDLMTNYRTDFQEYVNVTDPNASGIYDTYIDRFSARLALENKATPYFYGSIVYGIAGSERQGLYLVTMGEVLMSAEEYLDEDHIPVAGREAFCVMHGYDGIQVPTLNNVEERRRKAQVDGFCGAEGISPGTFNLGWYDYEALDGDGMQFLNTKWSVDMLSSAPTYYVAVGIVPKSYNPSLNEGFPLFKGKDYRSKIWQHSSPALWGSAIYKPDEQMRQYHPYQLAAIELGAGVNRGPLDTVNGRNGVFGLFGSGSGGGEEVSYLSVLELPYHPPFSLAGFAGMRLTPGWYDKQGNSSAQSIARARRIQYQAGVPGVGIGNSFADPCIEADSVYTFHENRANDSKVGASKLFSDYFDHALLINDALWDRWFCSSISDMPRSSSGTLAASETLVNFMEDKKPLPVTRYKKNITGYDKKDVIKRIMEDNGWLHIARFIIIEGGFNINSVSEEAWAATLQGLAKRDLMSNSGQRLHKINKEDNNVLFSRFMVSTSDKPIDDLSYSPLQGSSSLRPSLGMATAWGELRSLSPEQIRELAREIVKKVRERGPFLNMSDFINRRLDAGNDTSLTGALQAAIDATSINEMFQEADYMVKVQQEGSLFKYQKAAEGSMYTAAPGYLIQSDVLASLGNILTVRDDTFIVRAYGCVRNKRNAVLAQAWCEATVQRTIDYVDAANSPEDFDFKDSDPRKVDGTKKLTEINRIMGRKLRVIAFRWLDSWDI